MGWKDAPVISDGWKTAPLYAINNSFKETLAEEVRNAPWADRQLAAFGTSATNLWEGIKQFAGKEDKQQIEANQVFRDAAPASAIAGDVGLAALPFGLAGNSVKGATAIGSVYGGLQPVANANSAGDIVKGKLVNSAIGGASAGAGQAVSNKLMGSLTNKIGDVEQKVIDKAAQVAASETASARSAAGNAAQNAYRQLEHLRELGTYRPLTTQEITTIKTLEKELSDKSLEKLIPAATAKEVKANEFADAVKTEAQRASQYAAEKLSKKEAKAQIMARVKRYGPAAVGGVIGNALFPGLGGSVGGAATGLVLRPAIRSMINLQKNPAVQYAELNALDDVLKAASPLAPTLPYLTVQGLLGQ